MKKSIIIVSVLGLGLILFGMMAGYRKTKGGESEPRREDVQTARQHTPNLPAAGLTEPAQMQVQPVSPRRDMSQLLAEPLANGVTFDDSLSITIANVERKLNTTSICLAFRRIAPEWSTSARGQGFRLVIIDNRNNEYETYFSVGGPSQGLGGEPVDIENLPNGFTWTGLVKVTMPEIAPITRIELIRERIFIPKGEDVLPRCVQLDFSKPTTFPNLEFKPSPDQLLSPGDEVQIDENLSFRMGNLRTRNELSIYKESEEKFSFALPLLVKNVDYNEHMMPGFVPYVQLDDGRVVWCGSGEIDPLIPALSTTRWEIVGSIQIDKGLRDTIPNPRMFLLYICGPFDHHVFYRFVSITPDMKTQWSEATQRYLTSRSATEPTGPLTGIWKNPQGAIKDIKGMMVLMGPGKGGVPQEQAVRESNGVPADGKDSPRDQEPTGPLTGIWKNPQGAQFRIKDDDKTVNIELIRSNLLKNLSGSLTRRDKKADAKFLDGTLQTVFYIEPEKSRTIRTIGTLVDGKTLHLRCSGWPVWNQRGRRLGDRLMNETLTKQPSQSSESTISQRAPSLSSYPGSGGR